MNKTALIVVDVQNDFCEGGALPVTGGHQVARDINAYLAKTRNQMPVVLTRDWHEAPPSTNGGHFGDPPDFVDSWPVHCVQNTHGAYLHPALVEWKNTYPTFSKGMGVPAYSGFEGLRIKGRKVTLDEYLRALDVSNVLVCGLAADYCVRATALDAIKAGYSATILTDLTAGIARTPEEVADEIDHAQEVRT